MSLSTPEREYQDDTDLDVIQKSHNVKARHLRSPYNSSFWTPSRILFALVLYRCINALSIRTFFQPDEYFQSLEPAWQIAFGKDAGAWITWEWHHQLRSSLHPALFAGIYYLAGKVLEILQPSAHFRNLALANIPNLAQTFIAATGDFYTWKLSGKIYGEQSSSAWAALALTVLSPWQWFCSTRTFSNCLETTLTVVALHYWPQILISSDMPSKSGVPAKAVKILGIQATTLPVNGLRVSLLLAATACILRPTNLLIWSGICLPLAFNLSGRASRLPFSAYTVLLREACFAGITVLAISAISDRLYFQQWTFPPYHWLNFNISQDLAVFYGRNDWHYYLSQGLPLLLTTYLPFALIGLWRSTSLQSGQQAFTLASTTLLTIGTLSCIAHKEVRFIYPLLPILHVIAAPVVGTFFSEARTAESSSKRSTTSTLRRKPLLLFILLLNMAIAGYTSLVHQRGVLDVMIWLRNDFELLRLGGQSHSNAQPFSINETFVGFLMPCHSTPWRSSLMYPWLKAWALTCEPPIHLAARTEERLAYRDEADRFYDDPWLFMNSEIGTREDRPWPRYIVGFGGIGGDLERHAVKTMKGVEFVERWRGKNSDWHDDWRRTGDVVVWEMQNVENAYPQYNF